jgi:predicted amidohydrolase
VSTVVACCQLAGTKRGVAWVGGTAIVDAIGLPLAGGSTSAQPATLVAECDLKAALDKAISPNNDVLADRRPQLYERVARA